MKINWFRYINKLDTLGLLFSLVFILTLFIVAGIRLFYPYELEWIEGLNIDVMRWISDQRSIYIQPSIFFIPLGYTPIYFILSAGLMKLIGVGFVAPRIISIVATLGTLCLLYRIVSKETQYPVAGVIAAGLYAASYRFAGAWMDIAKTDSLFIFLILAAFYISSQDQGLWAQVISGALFVLAYFTKQTSLPIILVLAPISLFVSRGKTYATWLTTAILGGLIFLGWDQISQGWFSFYTFEIYVLQERVSDIFLFWRRLLPTMWPAILVAVIYMVTIITDIRPYDRIWAGRSWNYVGLFTALFLSSWSIYRKIWTYDNNLLQACLAIALIAGLCLGNFNIRLQGTSTPSNSLAIAKVGIFGLILTQFVFLIYNPIEQIPSQSDRLASQAIVERIKTLPGEVLVFQHGFYNNLAGKTTYFNSVPYGDVIVGRKPSRKSDAYWRREKTHKVVQQAIKEQYFDWVIVDTPKTNWFPYYLYMDQVIDVPKPYFPITGAQKSPQSIMIRNPVANGGKLPLNDPYLDGLFISGWDAPQAWGRRGIGEASVVYISMNKKHNYTLSIEVRSVCTGQELQTTSMQILWNRTHLDTMIFESCKNQIARFIIPETMLKKEYNHLEFIYEDVANRPQISTPKIEFHNLEFVQR